MSKIRKSARQVHFDSAGGFVATLVHDRGRLGAGHRWNGSAIVEEIDSTALVLPDYTAASDRYANLLVSPVR